MHVTVPIQKEALDFIVSRGVGKGPYTHTDDATGERNPGFWHKQDHSGPESRAGCAVEEALNTAR